MTQVFKRSRYTQRWQVESVISMFKRLIGSALRARRHHSKCRELSLSAVTLNVMFLSRTRVFYRAILTPNDYTVMYSSDSRLSASLKAYNRGVHCGFLSGIAPDGVWRLQS